MFAGMRIALILFAMIALQAAAWAASESGVARPGASYASAPMETPAACERACAEDGLCMAWNFAAGLCELKAVVPQPIVQAGATSGLSTRVPARLREQTAPATPPPEPPRPAPRATAIASLGDDLLGGPDAAIELRSGGGNSGVN